MIIGHRPYPVAMIRVPRQRRCPKDVLAQFLGDDIMARKIAYFLYGGGVQTIADLCEEYDRPDGKLRSMRGIGDYSYRRIAAAVTRYRRTTRAAPRRVAPAARY